MFLSVAKTWVDRLMNASPDSVANSADVLGLSWRARPRDNSKSKLIELTIV